MKYSVKNEYENLRQKRKINRDPHLFFMYI